MMKFSIILTTFNSERWIRRTIESIFNQTGVGYLFDFELIVVDDHSTDQTVELLNNLNVHVIVNDINSGGPNKGRNIGLKKCSGDYICIADHDDEWLPDKLSTMISYLDQASILTSGYKLLDHEQNYSVTIGCSNSTVMHFGKNVTFIDRLSKSKKGQNCYLGSIIFNSKLKHILFEETIGSLDFDWLLKLFHNNSSLEICQPLYIRHVYRNNLSLSEKYRNEDLLFAISCLNSYQNHYPVEVRKGRKRLYGTMGRYYYLSGNLKKARSFFIQSGLGTKNILYLATSFCCANLIKKYFKIFG